MSGGSSCLARGGLRSDACSLTKRWRSASGATLEIGTKHRFARPTRNDVSTSFTRSILAVSLLVVLVGTAARVAPLFDQGGRLFRQFPSEDGYLMLTMARNMALGHGLSVSNGTVATNGTQPAVTALGAVLFVLADGDKRAGGLRAAR